MWPDNYMNLFKTNEFVTKEDLRRFEYLLSDDVMLMGLVGKRPVSVLEGLNFPIVEEPLAAQEMMVVVLGDNEEGEYHETFDNFPYVVSASVDSFAPGMEIYEASMKMSLDSMDKKGEVFFDYFKRKVEEISLFDYFMEHARVNVDEDQMRFFVNSVIPNEMDAYLLKISDAMYMGGLDRWPVAKRVYQALTTGGMPTGWIGTPFDDGGDPFECMQLFFISDEADA
ncbi:hypothetical protein IMCC3135_09285 [Granulosicoccus antarcticus IMCC3135]|uniref:Uncharacterized protein n=2 Tax=Granulosicoccus TaxID=437504 RepID=A0A2Z2NXT5_9GAMM|nr:hypothetical protein IMCC3135_09285 [Granulosicoccus antarcticus IMCC3135]